MIAAVQAMRGRLGVGLLLLAVALTGCAASPPLSPPTGIDQLEIPTPSANPEDFRKVLDSAYFPSFAGSRELVSAESRETLTASFGTPTQVGGVWRTPFELRLQPASGRKLGAQVWWLSQDRQGNVWLFGEEYSGAYGDRGWQAATPWPKAGLMVAAEPRRGDAYVRFANPALPREVVKTLRASSYDESLARQCGNCVELEITAAGKTTLLWLRRGEGLVKYVDAQGRTFTALAAAPTESAPS